MHASCSSDHLLVSHRSCRINDQARLSYEIQGPTFSLTCSRHAGFEAHVSSFCPGCSQEISIACSYCVSSFLLMYCSKSNTVVFFFPQFVDHCRESRTVIGTIIGNKNHLLISFAFRKFDGIRILLMTFRTCTVRF